MGEIPWPAEKIQQMQRDVVNLSGLLGFLLKLEYGEPLSITVDGGTSTVSYDPEYPEPYDEVYYAISNNYLNSMRSLVKEINDLANKK
jgi:hypothetical protein